jgi:23S rRNA U2552 (ribose-2'-O)-methylase RlmE/FtsJ
LIDHHINLCFSSDPVIVDAYEYNTNDVGTIDMRVLDLGCAPGSWTMWAAQQVGERGYVLGLDMDPLKRQFGKNVKIMQQDIYQWDIPVHH